MATYLTMIRAFPNFDAMTTPAIKPNHKAIKAYYEVLKAYERQEVQHETALRSAFQSLLEQFGRSFRMDSHSRAFRQGGGQIDSARRHLSATTTTSPAATGKRKTATTISKRRSGRRSPRAIPPATSSSRTRGRPSSTRTANGRWSLT